MNVFVYGTLLQGLPNHPVMVHAYQGMPVKMAPAVIPDSEKMALCAFSRHLGFPYVTQVPEGRTIYGEIYFNVPNISPLDSLEGYPGFYNRSKVTTITNMGDAHKAWVYWIPGEGPHNIIESGSWVQFREDAA